MISEKSLIDLYRRVYSYPRLVKSLKIVETVSVIIIGAIFAYAIILLAIFEEYLSLVKLLTFSGIPFLSIGLVRSLINAQRPYDLFLIDELEQLRRSKKQGNSFPSRHVFSAFLIGTLWMIYSIPLGAIALFFGAYLAVERVLLGIHFVKDVVVGAVIGTVFGAVGILIW